MTDGELLQDIRKKLAGSEVMLEKFVVSVTNKQRYSILNLDSPYVDHPESRYWILPQAEMTLDALRLGVLPKERRRLAAIVELADALNSGAVRQKNAERKRVRSVVLPLTAAFLFYLFMAPSDCDALVGDLEERYKRIHKKFGASKANFWYWTQALSSVLPIVGAWAKKIIMKPAVAAITWAAAKHLLKDGRWLLTVAELYRKIRS